MGASGKQGVLFLCTHNSFESIIAEAILREVGADRFRVCSAGVQPSAQVPATVLEFLGSRGLPCESLHPRSWRELDASSFDFVFSLTDGAVDLLPRFAGRAVTAHWKMDELDLRDVFWTLNRRIRIFASLPHGKAERRQIQNRVHAIAAWA